MRSAILTGILFLTWACPSRGDMFDVRYQNPGTVTYDTLTFEVDGQPYAETVSGCTPEAGVCVAALDLGEGIHTVRAKAWSGSVVKWSGPSNTITVRGAPEPGIDVMLAMGVLGLAWRR